MAERAIGRLFRHVDGNWTPIGDRLPAFDHAPPDPTRPLAPWVLPRVPSPAPFDVVVVGESAHQLLARCDDDDPAVVTLTDQTAMLHGVEATAAWPTEVEVWVGRRIGPGRDWPLPPEPIPD